MLIKVYEIYFCRYQCLNLNFNPHCIADWKKIDFRIFFLYFYLKTFNLLLAYLILCSSIHIVVDIVVVFQQNFHFLFFILIEINIETNWNKSNRHLYLLHLRLNLTTDKQTKNSKHDDDKKNNKSRKDMEKNPPFHLCRQQYFQWHLSFSNTIHFNIFDFHFKFKIESFFFCSIWHISSGKHI